MSWSLISFIVVIIIIIIITLVMTIIVAIRDENITMINVTHFTMVNVPRFRMINVAIGDGSIVVIISTARAVMIDEMIPSLGIASLPVPIDPCGVEVVSLFFE